MPNDWMPIETATTCNGPSVMVPRSRKALNIGTKTTPPPVRLALA